MSSRSVRDKVVLGRGGIAGEVLARVAQEGAVTSQVAIELAFGRRGLRTG